MVLALYFSVVPGPSAVAFISYSSLGNIINATFFDEMKEKDRLYLNSQVVSAAIGHRRNTSLSDSVILSFQQVKVGQSCNLNLLRFHDGRPNNLQSIPSQWFWTCAPHMVPRS